MAYDPEKGGEPEYIGNVVYRRPPERDNNPPPPYRADEQEHKNSDLEKHSGSIDNCPICSPKSPGHGLLAHPCKDPMCQTCNPLRKDLPWFPGGPAEKDEEIPLDPEHDPLNYPSYCPENPRCTYIALQKTNSLLEDILKELRNF